MKRSRASPLAPSPAATAPAAPDDADLDGVVSSIVKRLRVDAALPLPGELRLRRDVAGLCAAPGLRVEARGPLELLLRLTMQPAAGSAPLELISAVITVAKYYPHDAPRAVIAAAPPWHGAGGALVSAAAASELRSAGMVRAPPAAAAAAAAPQPPGPPPDEPHSPAGSSAATASIASDTADLAVTFACRAALSSGADEARGGGGGGGGGGGVSGGARFATAPARTPQRWAAGAPLVLGVLCDWSCVLGLGEIVRELRAAALDAAAVDAA